MTDWFGKRRESVIAKGDMLRCREESSDSSKDAVDRLHILVISDQFHSR